MVDGLPRGVIGACLTPFRADGGVDEGALERELEFMVGHCDAVSMLGAEVSEYRMLTAEDRRRVLRRGIGQVNGRVPVLSGASSPRLPEVAELAALAAAAGADYVQVLIPRRPWGPDLGADEVLGYFTAVVEVSPLPVVVYHNPGYGSDPSPDLLVELSRLDGVVAFKESSRDMARIGRLIADIDVAGHAGYFTTMQPLLATLLQGGSGAMMPVPATLIGAEIVRAVRLGDLDAARRSQALFAGFPGRWKSYGLTPVMKCAMGHLGIDLGVSVSPYAGVAEAHAAEIGEFVADAGLPSRV
ncbi:MAG: dihydrodipicolinate synthase family protein [Streptosporangiales bacterium]|nr:dihydrodipicolinate synthase family protein [Streptosporangiales bacterium]